MAEGLSLWGSYSSESSAQPWASEPLPVAFWDIGQAGPPTRAQFILCPSFILQKMKEGDRGTLDMEEAVKFLDVDWMRDQATALAVPPLFPAGWPWARDLPLPILEFSPVKPGGGTGHCLCFWFGAGTYRGRAGGPRPRGRSE